MTRPDRFDHDYHLLHDLALFCHDVAAPAVRLLPQNRETQLEAVRLLTTALASRRFSISQEFLANEVILTDQTLLDSWCSQPGQLAWLMVHEQLSDFFARFMLRYRKPEPFLIHHVPKAGGTSVYAILREQGWFVAYPQTSFEAMASSYGVTGFCAQVATFEQASRHERIYIGGHYNLPQKITTSGLLGRCKGVILCRPPLDILSSAVRYIWTQIERGLSRFASHYGLGEITPAELKWLRQISETIGPARRRVAELVATILNSASFSAEYHEVLVKHFYDREVDSPDRLGAYLAGCGQLVTATDLQQDQSAVLNALQTFGTLPLCNNSIFPDEKLRDIMGGLERFASLVRPHLTESQRIFDVLAHRKGH